MAMKCFCLSGLLASAIFIANGFRFENAVAADRGDAQTAPANSSGGIAAARKPTGAPPPGGVAKPGLWQPLVATATSWKLINYNIRDQPDEDNAVIVSNYDLRQVGAAAVARLRWKTSAGEDVGSGEHLPQQVAVSGHEVWFLPLNADDDAVSQALTRKPTFWDPPVDVHPTRKNKWRWVQTSSGKHGLVTCIGHHQPRGGNECEDTCSGMVCFSATNGIVAVEGTSSPNFEYYALKGHQDD
jgi:hypothetical protein